MKDIILIGIVLLIIIALFGDGGLTVSPELSPALNAALTVDYSPDRRVTTIEQQTNIDTNVEQQTIVVNTSPAAAVAMPSGGGGSTIANGRPAGECFTVPGDVIVMQGSNGECQVLNAGNRFFVSPAGTRSWLTAESAEPTAVQAPQAPATTVDDRWAALVPLDELDTKQLLAAYQRNGGRLPLGFRLWTETEQRNWLAARAESWR
jgi:hypothetical protein